MNQEIEIKYRVETEEALTALEQSARAIFPRAKLKQVSQTNFFFDTSDLAVRRQGFGLRLRQEDEHFFLTLKGPSSGKKETSLSKVTQRLEFECEIERALAEELLSGRHDLIWVVDSLEPSEPSMRRTRDHLISLIKKLCAEKTLMLVGSFTNQRRILPVTIQGQDMKLEFDRTQFSHAPVHYEVELEIPSMEMLGSAEAFLSDLFAQCAQVPAYEKSKSERFYAFLARS